MPFRSAQTVAQIDWERWEPREHATLIFVGRGEDVLLIRKKRGLGAGKINAPGGRLDAGETALACALRELREEVNLTARRADERGELSFQFRDGYAVHVRVFWTDDWVGVPTETAEAIPQWTPRKAVPFEEMWQDDRFWIPLLFAGIHFRGRFIFDGDSMQDYSLEETA
jgi:8-oxo-dGTP diphosphatase